MGIQRAVRFNIDYFIIQLIQTPGLSLAVIKIENSAEKKEINLYWGETAVVGNLPSTHYHPQSHMGIPWINMWLLVRAGWETISLAQETFPDFKNVLILHHRGRPSYC